MIVQARQLLRELRKTIELSEEKASGETPGSPEYCSYMAEVDICRHYVRRVESIFSERKVK